MKKHDLGFTESFLEEMQDEQNNVRLANKKAIWGELASYILFVSEVIKNILFYIKFFKISNYDVRELFFITAIIGLISLLIIIVNYIRIERLLNNKKLATHNYLIILGYLIYGSYSNILLNIFFYFLTIESFFSIR
ncbi:hypothetical protein C0Z22_10515 [Halobacteriovorax sp. DA5]|nr:hypothetical protein C0Z22_10515 [Halobacteriovorax sp. DA5]